MEKVKSEASQEVRNASVSDSCGPLFRPGDRGRGTSSPIVI